MIILAVLFGAAVTGLTAIGLLVLRTRRATGTLSTTAARALEKCRASGASPREGIGRSGAGA
ncbi:hypothetical protein [Nocardiopsis sp. ATB16-24]|uniref:hypothetical protein n=1 Tax=Nocardiopsis sp. ATB16-24 TaxID=3019555 RepID=UPI00255328F7|nr:hypothetical protein [Nocardiopsis sp. ATB16-24]